MLTRVFLALILIVPLAAASAQTWADPAGDAQAFLALGLPSPAGLACHDPQADVTSVAADSSDEAIVFTLALAGDAAPACSLDGTPASLELVRASRMAALYFSAPGASEYLWMESSTNWDCFGEFETGPLYGQIECATTWGADGIEIAFPSRTWAWNLQTGEVVDGVDLREVAWPDGWADVSTYARGPAAGSPSVGFHDEVPLAGWDP